MPYRLTPHGRSEARFAPAAPVVSSLREALSAAVKAEAARRILALAPDWKQRNATARAVELVRKGEAAWTADEAAEAAGIEALWTRIKAIRGASDRIEEGLAAAGPDALAAFDVDAGWP